MPDPIFVEQQEHIAVLTLNRPEKLNAIDRAMVEQLTAALDRMEEDHSVRAIILTGAGDRAFSAGADIASLPALLKRGPEAALRDFVRRGQRLTSRIENFPKPVIAAVNGLAYGGGSELIEAAPLAIASERATFCKAEIDLGFAPPFGGSQRLPRLIGRKRALAMILTADPIDAPEAQRIGLVNAVVPQAALREATFDLAQKIAAKEPLAVAACLGAVTRGLNVPIEQGLAIEADYFARMAATPVIEKQVAAWLARER